MKVKKYIVDTLPQAMGQIKAELGNDAIILHTKKIKIGGIFGFFGKEKIEVIAAIDGVTNAIQQPAAAKSTNTVDVKKQYQQISQPYHGVNSYEKNKESYSTAETSFSSEVNEIKKMMVRLMISQGESTNALQNNKEIKAIYERLINQGVKDEIALGIIEKVMNRSEENGENIPQLVKQELISIMNKSTFPTNSDQEVKIIHVVGPTGVGKTTTIAKLAAEKVLKDHKKVAFITADTYRIGAVDQLRTYAEIFHAPVEVVFSPQDTMKAIEKFKDYDLIFMDTAGRNYHNEMYVSELNNILSKTNASQTYLALSLTQKFEDMVSILDQFKKIKIDKLLFTKFDETVSYGAILNILSSYSYKASYITLGQNVPDDIEQFDVEKIASTIMGG